MPSSSSSGGKDDQNWVLMWEDGFSHFPITALRLITGLNRAPSESSLLEWQKRLQALYTKMSYQMYNYGEDYIGKVALRGNHRWVLRDEFLSDNPASILEASGEQVPPGWTEQFEAGIQTIAVIAVPQGVLQLGSLAQIPENHTFVHGIRDIFRNITAADGMPDGMDASPPMAAVEFSSQSQWKKGSSADNLLSALRAAAQSQLQGQSQQGDVMGDVPRFGRSISVPLDTTEAANDANILNQLATNWRSRGSIGNSGLVGGLKSNLHQHLSNVADPLASMKEVAERLIGSKRPAASQDAMSAAAFLKSRGKAESDASDNGLSAILAAMASRGQNPASMQDSLAMIRNSLGPMDLNPTPAPLPPREDPPDRAARIRRLLTQIFRNRKANQSQGNLKLESILGLNDSQLMTLLKSQLPDFGLGLGSSFQESQGGVQGLGMGQALNPRSIDEGFVNNSNAHGFDLRSLFMTGEGSNLSRNAPKPAASSMDWVQPSSSSTSTLNAELDAMVVSQRSAQGKGDLGGGGSLERLLESFGAMSQKQTAGGSSQGGSSSLEVSTRRLQETIAASKSSSGGFRMPGRESQTNFGMDTWRQGENRRDRISVDLSGLFGSTPQLSHFAAPSGSLVSPGGESVMSGSHKSVQEEEGNDRHTGEQDMYGMLRERPNYKRSFSAPIQSTMEAGGSSPLTIAQLARLAELNSGHGGDSQQRQAQQESGTGDNRAARQEHPEKVKVFQGVDVGSLFSAALQDDTSQKQQQQQQQKQSQQWQLPESSGNQKMSNLEAALRLLQSDPRASEVLQRGFNSSSVISAVDGDCGLAGTTAGQSYSGFHHTRKRSSMSESSPPLPYRMAPESQQRGGEQEKARGGGDSPAQSDAAETSPKADGAAKEPEVQARQVAGGGIDNFEDSAGDEFPNFMEDLSSWPSGLQAAWQGHGLEEQNNSGNWFGSFLGGSADISQALDGHNAGHGDIQLQDADNGNGMQHIPSSEE